MRVLFSPTLIPTPEPWALTVAGGAGEIPGLAKRAKWASSHKIDDTTAEPPAERDHVDIGLISCSRGSVRHGGY